MDLLLQLALLGIATGLLYAPAALGFGLVLGQTKIFHIAYGGVYLVAGYIYYYCTTVWKIGTIPALVLTALAAIGAGLLIHLIAYRPLLAKRRLSFLVGFVASLGVLTVIGNILVLINGGSFVELERTILSTGRLTIGQLYLQVGHIVGLIAALAVAIGLHVWLKHSHSGHAVGASGADRRLARIYGIDVERCDLVVAVVASLVLLPTAILIPSLTGLSGGSGLVVGMFALTATVIGGLGSIAGTVMAAVLLGLVENVGLFWLPGAWQQAIGLGIMVIVLLVRPSGLFVSGRSAASLSTAGA
jgi:branched-chain amino acid transport system permease protein